MNTGRFIKAIWEELIEIIVAFFTLLSIVIILLRVIGFKAYIVLSGSMEPTYHVGSIIYVKEADYRKLQTGDVITFRLSQDTVATHRIVEVLPDEESPELLLFRTKGDANLYADGQSVDGRDIIGTPVFSLPYLGYVVMYLRQPPGLYAVIALCSLLLFSFALPHTHRREGKKHAASGKDGHSRAEK